MELMQDNVNKNFYIKNSTKELLEQKKQFMRQALQYLYAQDKQNHMSRMDSINEFGETVRPNKSR